MASSATPSLMRTGDDVDVVGVSVGRALVVGAGLERDVDRGARDGAVEVASVGAAEGAAECVIAVHIGDGPCVY